VNPGVEAARHFVVDLSGKARQAPERRLDVTAGTPETVVQIEMAKSGVEIVVPHQTHHAAAEPNAFGISSRAVDGLCRFGDLIGLTLIFFGGCVRGSRICSRRLAGLILSRWTAALSHSAAQSDDEADAGKGEVAQNRSLKLKHTSTHRFPESCQPA
jgi:hypothetical protein